MNKETRISIEDELNAAIYQARLDQAERSIMAQLKHHPEAEAFAQLLIGCALCTEDVYPPHGKGIDEWILALATNHLSDLFEITDETISIGLKDGSLSIDDLEYGEMLEVFQDRKAEIWAAISSTKNS